jgi:cobalt-zinc-cadmium efflux system membrane fusion protein
MKTSRLLLWIPLLLSVACQKDKAPDEAAMVADSMAMGGETAMVRVSKEQFDQTGMELGRLMEYSSAEAVASNGYIDVPPQNRRSISTYLGGFISVSDLLPGDRVTKGQVMVTLENIEYLKLQENFLEAKEKLDYLKSVYDSQAALTEENVSSRRNYLQAKADYQTTRAAYESLSKQLQLIHIDPSQVEAGKMVSTIGIPAPFDGYITKMNVVNGMFVNPSDVICEVVNNSHLHLELKVFEKDLLKLERGQTIEFRLPEISSKVYTGEVILIGKSVEQNERTILVHGHIHQDNHYGLTPGMYVEARIKTRNKMLRGLPAESLLKADGKDQVLVLRSEKEGWLDFEKVPVDVGESTEEWFEVRNPAALDYPDQIILVRGAFNLD